MNELTKKQETFLKKMSIRALGHEERNDAQVVLDRGSYFDSEIDKLNSYTKLYLRMWEDEDWVGSGIVNMFSEK